MICKCYTSKASKYYCMLEEPCVRDGTDPIPSISTEPIPTKNVQIGYQRDGE